MFKPTVTLSLDEFDRLRSLERDLIKLKKLYENLICDIAKVGTFCVDDEGHGFKTFVTISSAGLSQLGDIIGKIVAEENYYDSDVHEILWPFEPQSTDF